MPLYVGLMSGTSLDGVDGVLVALDEKARPDVRAHAHRPFDSTLRAELLALNTPGSNELHRAALAANALAAAYAEVVAEVRRQAGAATEDICAIGAHGQTVRHRPQDFDGRGYTLQLLNGALLAERTGIDVVCDFRSRDVAAGGQGAPLAPAFHAAVFGSAEEDRAVLNLGGIANLSLLGRDGGLLGFDCGPANALLDGWCQRHLGLPYDAEGRWAAGGQVDDALLQRLLAEPFFDQAPPKSTGRDLFHLDWLEQKLAMLAEPPSPRDVQATLAALTVEGVARQLRRWAPAACRLLVCGGGANNAHLMRSLAAALPGVQVQPTDEEGVPAQQVEAIAFAWLAQCFVQGWAGNRVEVTGASGPRLLGALYPAG